MIYCCKLGFFFYYVLGDSDSIIGLWGGIDDGGVNLYVFVEDFEL